MITLISTSPDNKIKEEFYYFLSTYCCLGIGVILIFIESIYAKIDPRKNQSEKLDLNR